MPGESSHEIGRAYVHVFAGCLERILEGFQCIFNVYGNPDKLEFHGISGAPFSFDMLGLFIDRAEVFIESKAYNVGSGLLDDYRTFLAKAYSARVLHPRYRNDFFWFVTNVPFGSSEGRQLWSADFISKALRGSKSKDGALLLGEAPIDEQHVRALSEQITVAILTDSFIKVAGVSYRMRQGENLWKVIKLIHGGVMPQLRYAPIVEAVQRMNHLSDPNRIRSGEPLHLPWFGMERAEEMRSS
jgi:hypothetical protein